jgi:hypothetical protein
MNELYSLHRFILQTPQYGAANAHFVQQIKQAMVNKDLNDR